MFVFILFVVNIAIFLPDVSGILLEAVDVLFDVVWVLFFTLVVLFDVFGTLPNVAILLVVGSSVSADVVGVPVDAIG